MTVEELLESIKEYPKDMEVTAFDPKKDKDFDLDFVSFFSEGLVIYLKFEDE